MVLNTEKYHFMYIGKIVSDSELLWKIVWKLKRASRKLTPLSRVLLNIDSDKKTLF